MPYCTKATMRDLRLLCSASCGCGNPLSGLFFEGEYEGCPREICRVSQQYQAVLATRECRDLDPAELRALPAWHAFFDQYVAWASNILPELTPQVRNVRKAFLAYGCKTLSMTRLGGISQSSFCEDTSTQGSVRSFCPVSCRCRDRMATNCPRACALPLLVNGTSN